MKNPSIADFCRIPHISALLALVCVAVLSGCAGNRDIVRSIATSTGEGVYEKIKDQATVPGYADLYISSSIKTHNQERYSFGECNHGKPQFFLVINIDGQAMPLVGSMKEEGGGYPCETDPEAGEGVRYRFREAVRLKPGKHTLKIAIPDDDVVMVKEITLKEGSNELGIRPVYSRTGKKPRAGFSGDTTFYEGVKRVVLLLDGKEI